MAKNMVTFKLDGDEELLRNLIRLGDAVAGAALGKATLRGADVLEQAAERMAPGPHIETQIIEEAPGLVVVAIGPDKDHWYYQFSETGASPHEIPTTKAQGETILHFEGGPDGETFAFKVDHPGMAAAPFLRPAVDTQKDKAIDALADELTVAMAALFKGGAR